MTTAAEVDPAVLALRYAASFIDEACSQGVSNWVICPGSRSTPLTLAVAGQPSTTAWTHVDERSAAFFALGLAKGIRAPAGLICTSGTAAANFLPAIVEAHQSGIPMIVLTADRPPESRETGALQTIDQSKLYAGYTKWFFEMALSGEGVGTDVLARSVAREAAARSMAPPRGPIHINWPFREPLVPVEIPAQRDDVRPTRSEASVTRRTMSPAGLQSLAKDLEPYARGLIVCGPQDDPQFAQAARALSATLGYPILADPLSQLRGTTATKPTSEPVLVIENYDTFLRDEAVQQRLRPDVVLRFGLTPISKSLLAYLSRADDARQISIMPQGLPNDPLRSVSRTIDADPGRLADDLCKVVHTRSGSTRPWTQAWETVSRTTALTLDAHLATIDYISEPKVFATLADCLGHDSILFVGNSMPIRDLDAFFTSPRHPVRVLGNRGVNGIDGIISSALGVAAGTGRRVVLAVGDLSFYHDLNGLLAAKLHHIDATVVLLNNDGGGIFHFLPQAKHESFLERYFAVPTGLDFRPVVEMYGGRFLRPGSWDGFRQDLIDSLNEPGLTVLELKTDRTQNTRDHAMLWHSVRTALEQNRKAEPG